MRYIIALFLFCSIFSARQAACIDTAMIGKLAPPFTLADANGKQVALSDYTGKVILLNFWATYCESCVKEMPSLHNLFNAYEKKGLIVLAISKDNSEADVRSFIKKKPITLPVLLDKDQEVSFDLYCVSRLPTSFLIDRAGIIIKIIIGEKVWDDKDMKDKIASLLSKNNKEGK
jgi:peroxiredoxin